MVRKSQLAIEFVASTMIFLFAAVLVISSIFRGYSSVSDASRTIALETRAEKVALELSSSSTNGFGSVSGGLDWAKLSSINPANYSALREVSRFKEDYSFSISYLPSIVIGVYFENTLARSPGEAASSFDTFSNRTPINMTIIPRQLDGRMSDGRTYALLISPDDSLIDAKESDSSGRVSLVPGKEGVYTLRIITYDPADTLYGTREFSLGVVST